MEVENFLDKISKNTHIPNLMKIRSLGAELFQWKDGKKDRYDAVNSRF